MQNDANAQAQTLKSAQRRILTVDDDRLSSFVMSEKLINLGYAVDVCDSGAQALDTLSEAPDAFDVVLLDRMMPEMDGIEVVRRLAKHESLRHVPVVMVTGANTPEDMREGIDVGVFHYLAKPVDSALLQSVVSAALRQGAVNKALREDAVGATAFDQLTAARFTFRTMSQAQMLAGFLANCFPDPDRALHGLAALLFNAVEHGLLEIGFERKGELLRDGALHDEIERLSNLESNKAKSAEVSIARKADGVYVVVTDNGPGFRWKEFVTIDSSRASTGHGRGIAQAKATSFDKLTYNESGNRVVAFTSLDEEIVW